MKPTSLAALLAVTALTAASHFHPRASPVSRSVEMSALSPASSYAAANPNPTSSPEAVSPQQPAWLALYPNDGDNNLNFPEYTAFVSDPDTVYTPLDAPRFGPRPNGTSFEYWYFDAVNPDRRNETVVVIFYTATNASLPFHTGADTGLLPGGSVSVEVFFSFSDGTILPYWINSADSDRGAAQLLNTGGNVSATWENTGFSFFSSPDGQTYKVTISDDLANIHGTIEYSLITGPRYPCSLVSDIEQSLEFLPHVGFTNAAPDANAKVQFSMNSRGFSKTLSFSGFGYHDNVWGDQPLVDSVQTWVKGHARFGNNTYPVSLAWAYALDHANKVHTSVFISQGNQVLFQNCQHAVDPSESIITPDAEGESYQIAPTLVTGEIRPLWVFKGLQIAPCGDKCTRYSGYATDLSASAYVNGSALFEVINF